MPLPEGMLCSVNEVKLVARPVLEWLASIGKPISDSEIETMIKVASQEIEWETNRNFTPERATEWYDGNDGTTLVLRRFPVLKVHTVRIWGGRHFLIWEFPPDKIIYEGEYTKQQYQQAELLVRREIGQLNITLGLLEWFMPIRMQPPLFIWNRRFVQGHQNIEVDYTAGYGVPDPNDPDKFLPEPPAEIRRAVALKVGIKLTDLATGYNLGVTSRTLGDRTETFGSYGIFGTLRERWLEELYGKDGKGGIIGRWRAIVAR